MTAPTDTASAKRTRLDTSRHWPAPTERPYSDADYESRRAHAEAIFASMFSYPYERTTR